MRLTLLLAIAIAMLGAVGCADRQQKQIERAQSQVRKLAEDLDRKTTETGVYVRVDADEIHETDPWGTRLQVGYAQGGLAETVTVRSAGPDGEFHTQDDIESLKVSANFKGVGTGIAKHAEQAATSTAKGIVKGAVAGVKESFLKNKKKSGHPNEGETAP